MNNWMEIPKNQGENAKYLHDLLKNHLKGGLIL